MKKKLLILALASVFCMSGCGEKDKSAASITEEVDRYAEEMQEAGQEGLIAPSEAVRNLLVKTWKADGKNDVYTMRSDGTGTKNEEPFTFECGFDEDNNITLEITLDSSEETELYALSSDETGYGLDLASLNNGEDIRLVPADLEFLDMEDERASGIVGEWKDESGNSYVFGADNRVTVKGSDQDTEGTFSAVQDAEGTLLLKLVVPGGSLEFAYTLNEDKSQIELCSPGSDVVHVWTRGQENK